jgi:hypothetical protein
MNCKEFKELMAAYLEDILDEEKKRSFAEHLKECASCQAELKEISNLCDRLVTNGKVLAQGDLENVVLDRIIREQNVKLKTAAQISTSLKIRRIIMRSRITQLAAAAVIVVAAFLGLSTMFDYSTTSAYAVEQTIEALRNVSTAHMFCRGWDDKEFEMWMSIDPVSGLPNHVYMHHSDFGVTIVSTPDVSYQYVEKMNFVGISKGQLLNFDVRFDRILEDMVKEMTKGENIKIYTEKNHSTGENVIVVYAESGKNTWKFFIDPETKLPISILCVRFEQPGSFVKAFDQIYFDMELPEGIFDFQIPQGAKLVDMDRMVKLLDDPNYGISTEGLTNEEAASLVAKEYWHAVINLDQERIRKICPVDILGDELRYAIFAGKIPTELIEVGKPYVDHYCGLGHITPCILKLDDGTTKQVKIITKFRQINGQLSCVVAGLYAYPDEIQETKRE